jgi:threonine dehydrogenase-like Zn-dependent dehydrogenase
MGDHRIVTTLCPGGKERMRRLMEVVRNHRVDLRPLLTHTFLLDKIADAY